MRRVIFFTEGGRDYGFGHVARSGAVAKELLRRGADISFFVAGDGTVSEVLSGIDFEITDWHGKYESVISSGSFFFVDSYRAGAGFFAALKSDGKFAVIDDYNRLDYGADILINPSVGAEKIEYGKGSASEFLVGAKYVILREPFGNAGKIEIRKSIENVFLSLGATRNNLLGELEIFLTKSGFNVLKAEPGSGRGADDIYKKMFASDIAVSAGGQTLYELISLGVPTIAVSVADNQKTNISGLLEAGAILFAGNGSDPRIVNLIKDAFERVKDYELRLSMYKNSSVVDNGGVNRIVNKIEKLFMKD